MTKIYCYDRCSTCKKALAWCEANGIQYEKIDIKGDHPDEATLRELHKKSGLPLKRFFNTSRIFSSSSVSFLSLEKTTVIKSSSISLSD